MKANAPKRKIFDAVDMLTEDPSARVQGEAEKGVQMSLTISIRSTCMKVSAWTIWWRVSGITEYCVR
jgi:hypothetical protein